MRKGQTRPYCKMCKSWDKNLLKGEIRLTKRWGAVRSMICSECNARRGGKYYHKNKEKLRRVANALYHKNREYYKRQSKINFMINRGELVRPDTCPKCHTDERRINAIVVKEDAVTGVLTIRWRCGVCSYKERKGKES